ncbi:MAG: putative benzoate transporter protein [Ilumatobacteraceae bacterium]|nr:putative benzoate transporter protein [Ilumatobacteraceae bacterium]
MDRPRGVNDEGCDGKSLVRNRAGPPRRPCVGSVGGITRTVPRRPCEVALTSTRSQPIIAGIIAALVGFSSSFTIVLAGLKAAGATDEQAGSGLLMLSLGMGMIAMVASFRTRMPISVAWSTPGAALMVSAGAIHGGYKAAIGAFIVAGLLAVLAGLWRPLARWIGAIPGPLASALLAGVLLPVCLSPAKAVVEEPRLTIPIVVVWLLLVRFARRWAVPGALVAAVVSIAFGPHKAFGGLSQIWPRITVNAPAFDIRTLIGLGVPLFIVTMASQNVAGIAVLRSFGYQPNLRPLFVSTGAATAVGAPFGVHGINLAALTAAMVAGPDADPEPDRRWLAAFSSGASYIVLGLFAALATTAVAVTPTIVVSAVAGLALLGALAGALHSAMADHAMRDAAVVTLVVSASGVTAFGISSPFWGLSAGLIMHGMARWKSTPPAT